MKKVRISLLLAVLTAAISAAPGCRKGPDGETRVSVSGVIEAVTTNIQAQAQGEVEKVLVKEGQKVAKGDLLCTINSDKLRIQLDQVRAGIAGAKAKRQLPGRDRGQAARARRKRPAAVRPAARRRRRLPNPEGKGRSGPQSRPGAGQERQGKLRHGRPREGEGRDRHDPGRPRGAPGPGAIPPPAAPGYRGQIPGGGHRRGEEH
jgi:pyruvate/2-oxoglutarate dehydrogenase complex dihydrolipoamide acyltransferase (E2) component